MYRDLIPMLADRYHVIAPDMPGFGLTETPGQGEFSYTSHPTLICWMRRSPRAPAMSKSSSTCTSTAPPTWRATRSFRHISASTLRRSWRSGARTTRSFCPSAQRLSSAMCQWRKSTSLAPATSRWRPICRDRACDPGLLDRHVQASPCSRNLVPPRLRTGCSRQPICGKRPDGAPTNTDRKDHMKNIDQHLSIRDGSRHVARLR